MSTSRRNAGFCVSSDSVPVVRVVTESHYRLAFTVEDSQQNTIAWGVTPPIKITNVHRKQDTQVPQSTPGNEALSQHANFIHTHTQDYGIPSLSILRHTQKLSHQIPKTL